MRDYHLSLDDLFAELSWFSPERKIAVAFAIYADLALFDVVRLKWSDELELNWRAEFILKNVPVSASIDNVFWERQQGSDVEMSSLPCLFDMVANGQDFEFFVGKYRFAIPVELNRLV